jgi:hypothetical protein
VVKHLPRKHEASTAKKKKRNQKIYKTNQSFESFGGFILKNTYVINK